MADQQVDGNIQESTIIQAKDSTIIIKKRDAEKEIIPEKPLLFIPHPYPEAPNFTGRKKERAMLRKWLTEDKEHPLLSMVAIGGMGKSALAWRWLMEDVMGEDCRTY